MIDERWAEAARGLRGDADFWSLRIVDERTDEHEVRNDVAQPLKRTLDRGAMLTAWCGAGAGYAATPDLSPAGLQAALDAAIARAKAAARWSLIDHREVARPARGGSFVSPGVGAALPTRADWLARLAHECAAAAIDPRIVERTASVMLIETDQLYLTSDGIRIDQRFAFVTPELTAVAHADGETETRSLGGGRGMLSQGGLAVFEASGFAGAGARVADEALQLLAAPNCPSGPRDLLLMPDQMMLQIHESIGHPLELDRILGDERNFAGWSFVKPEMFGSYQYGSALLNVSFDPELPGEAASYAYDDDGTPAAKAYLIRRGILERPLGGALSAQRAGLPGVANSRASNWNRAPIDRMANLNIEPGDASLDATDRRHRARHPDAHQYLLVDRRSTQQVPVRLRVRPTDRERQAHPGGAQAPNYRGISANFWRSLRAVGDAGTFEVHGTPYCGKGEPNQVIRVGHASPACVFADVDVFGGA